MKFFKILILLTLSGCASTTFSPEWDKTGREVTVVTHRLNNQAELYQIMRTKYGIKDAKETHAFFSQVGDVCNIYFVMVSSPYGKIMNDVGHEFLHCIYGRYHKD